MKTAFLLTPILIVLMSCAKDADLTEDYRNDSVAWMIGAEHATDTTMLLPKSVNADGTLSVESYSICPNSDLRILVTAGSEALLDTTYHDGDSHYTIPGSKGKELSVHSWLVDNGSLILCVWLGQATLKYDYVE